MYKYEFTMINDMVFEFESKLHISMLMPLFLKEGDEVATFVFFHDTEHTFNLTKTKRLKINGVDYQFKQYIVN